MSVLRWDRAVPDRCSCAGRYRPVLNARGKLVKARDPAWRMAEQTRDPGCLQEHCRALSKVYPVGYQHHKTSKGSGAGYPDVHLWTPIRETGGGSAYAELKRMGHNPTVVQRTVMAQLQDATPDARVYLIRPCCLLTGVVDEVMADLSGTPCRYIGAGRAYTPVEIGAGAPLARARPVPTLPGMVPAGFAPACGYLIPPPTGPSGYQAMQLLEDWLRRAGFSPTDVPYPIRLIIGPAGQLHVQCRAGLASPGADTRTWRAAVADDPFPEHLVAALSADQMIGPSSQRVADLISGLSPSAQLQETTR